MTTFIALYRGVSVGDAKLVAVTADPNVVRDFAGRLLADELPNNEQDAVFRELESGRRSALRLVCDGAED
ncbi:MAG: hypothetical protein M3P49_14240 [Actinomycetota bacterium]|nr:hypothetical protein [Actinomycetota bacterium]